MFWTQTELSPTEDICLTPKKKLIEKLVWRKEDVNQEKVYNQSEQAMGSRVTSLLLCIAVLRFVYPCQRLAYYYTVPVPLYMFLKNTKHQNRFCPLKFLVMLDYIIY